MTIIPIEFGTPEYDETVRLRDLILRKPLGLDFSPSQLAREYENYHLACYDEQQTLVACLVLDVVDLQTLKMRQVAVAESVQGQGIGTRLVEASEVFGRRNGFQEMVLNAREVAVPFYLRMGYEKVGEPFEEVTIPHYKMRKALV